MLSVYFNHCSQELRKQTLPQVKLKIDCCCDFAIVGFVPETFLEEIPDI